MYVYLTFSNLILELCFIISFLIAPKVFILNHKFVKSFNLTITYKLTTCAPLVLVACDCQELKFSTF